MRQQRHGESNNCDESPGVNEYKRESFRKPRLPNEFCEIERQAKENRETGEPFGQRRCNHITRYTTQNTAALTISAVKSWVSSPGESHPEALVGEPGVRRRAEFYYQQLDALRTVRQEVRRELLAEGKKHKAWKRLCQIPSIGPIRSAVLLGILQTPHRFRTKRQLWTYSGFGIETQSSADHRSVDGQLQRAKKQSSIRGLNQNCNHDLKNLFKGAAIVASSKPGPFREFYTALLTKGIRPEMARLTLARKIATIVLMVWKRGACFDAQHLKPQTA